MRGGGLADRVALTRPSAQTQDSVGQIVGDPVALATVWGQLNPRGGKERFAGQFEVAEIDATILIRYRPDMDPSEPRVTDTRATVYGVEYDILSVIDAMDGGAAFRGLLIACKHGLTKSG
jgi:SPP1 family predicted phage head-tail adaptor